MYAARGKYILRLDADDWLHPNAIEIMYNYLEKNKKAEFVFPDFYEVDHRGKILSHINDTDIDEANDGLTDENDDDNMTD